MADRRRRTAKVAEFTVQTFKSIGLKHATIYRSGSFFMQVETIEGAETLANILNLAASLNSRSDLLGGEAKWSRQRIAGAVAKAMGGMIDFESFQPEKQEAANG